MGQQSKVKPSVVGELGRWLLATMLMSATAMMVPLLWMGGAQIKEVMIAGAVVAGVLSLTWGSWASLLWTRRRIIKLVMMVVVAMPGALMVGGGLWAFVTMPENRFIWRWGWLVVAGHGLGAMALGLMLTGSRSLTAMVSVAERSRKVALGWTLFPIVSAAMLGGVLAVVVAMWPEFGGAAVADQEMVERLARWTIPSQVLVMVTTVVPATAFWLSDELSRGDD